LIKWRSPHIAEVQESWIDVVDEGEESDGPSRLMGDEEKNWRYGYVEEI
jgi:hypothetical protein